MGRRRAVLGRGLDALIPTRGSVREVRLDDIIPHRSQPRVRFDDDKLNTLAESIKEHGILQPLVVSTPDSSGKHHLIVGERRWQAAKLAGLESAPVVERSVEDASALEMALVENIQRQDLDPLEEAGAFERLVRDFAMSQEDIAQRVGRSRSSVANSLRLLNLPLGVREALIEGRISEGHPRAILALREPMLMENVLRRVIAEDLTVRRTERLVAASQNDNTDSREVHGPSTQMHSIEDQLRRTLRTKVSVVKGKKSGRIVIEFYSDDDLEGLLKLLLHEAET